MPRPRPAGILVALVILTGACSKSAPSPATTAETPTPPAATAKPAEPPKTAAPQPPPAEAKRASAEELLRAELKTWMSTPYADNGTSRAGIGNSGLVRAVLHGALNLDIPSTHDEQLRTGKLVAQDALEPGDLVFFEGKGFGPFRPKSVGLFIGHDDVALATKEQGVTVVHLSESRWSSVFKTARHIPTDARTGAPTFDAASYGENRAALLQDIAKAWKGTLYRQGGTTFDGIGNDEFVREVYGAIYDTELEGTPSGWAKMGHAVARDALEPGDIILYEAVGLGKLVSQRHAGIYIGDGQFVHSVKGSAVTISKLDDPRWNSAFRAARRIDPDLLTRSQEARVEPAHPPADQPTKPSAPTAPRKGAKATAAEPAGSRAVASAAPHVVSDRERRLREATDAWRGTPYKIGGTSKSGVDCSAFVRAIYKDVFGFELPRTAEEQERLGAMVERQRLESGDLVFFRTQGMGPLFKSRHVGLYLGGGEFAQSSGRLGVTVTPLDNYYWSRKYATARRLSNAAPSPEPLARGPEPLFRLPIPGIWAAGIR
jgi:cell wall-associated NlpC family hydrolase